MHDDVKDDPSRDARRLRRVNETDHPWTKVAQSVGLLVPGTFPAASPARQEVHPLDGWTTSVVEFDENIDIELSGGELDEPVTVEAMPAADTVDALNRRNIPGLNAAWYEESGTPKIVVSQRTVLADLVARPAKRRYTVAPNGQPEDVRFIEVEGGRLLRKLSIEFRVGADDTETQKDLAAALSLSEAAGLITPRGFDLVAARGAGKLSPGRFLHGQWTITFDDVGAENLSDELEVRSRNPDLVFRVRTDPTSGNPISGSQRASDLETAVNDDARLSGFLQATASGDQLTLHTTRQTPPALLSITVNSMDEPVVQPTTGFTVNDRSPMVTTKSYRVRVPSHDLRGQLDDRRYPGSHVLGDGEKKQWEDEVSKSVSARAPTILGGRHPSLSRPPEGECWFLHALTAERVHQLSRETDRTRDMLYLPAAWASAVGNTATVLRIRHDLVLTALHAWRRFRNNEHNDVPEHHEAAYRMAPIPPREPLYVVFDYTDPELDPSLPRPTRPIPVPPFNGWGREVHDIYHVVGEVASGHGRGEGTPLREDWVVLQIARVRGTNEDWLGPPFELPHRSPRRHKHKADEATEHDLTMVGHPLGVPTRIAEGGYVVEHGQDYFRHSLLAYAGSSGSPIFRLVDEDDESGPLTEDHGGRPSGTNTPEHLRLVGMELGGRGLVQDGNYLAPAKPASNSDDGKPGVNIALDIRSLKRDLEQALERAPNQVVELPLVRAALRAKEINKHSTKASTKLASSTDLSHELRSLQSVVSDVTFDLGYLAGRWVVRIGGLAVEVVNAAQVWAHADNARELANASKDATDAVESAVGEGKWTLPEDDSTRRDVWAALRLARSEHSQADAEATKAETQDVSAKTEAVNGQIELSKAAAASAKGNQANDADLKVAVEKTGGALEETCTETTSFIDAVRAAVRAAADGEDTTSFLKDVRDTASAVDKGAAAVTNANTAAATAYGAIANPTDADTSAWDLADTSAWDLAGRLESGRAQLIRGRRRCRGNECSPAHIPRAQPRQDRSPEVPRLRHPSRQGTRTGRRGCAPGRSPRRHWEVDPARLASRLTRQPSRGSPARPLQRPVRAARPERTGSAAHSLRWRRLPQLDSRTEGTELAFDP